MVEETTLLGDGESCAMLDESENFENTMDEVLEVL